MLIPLIYILSDSLCRRIKVYGYSLIIRDLKACGIKWTEQARLTRRRRWMQIIRNTSRNGPQEKPMFLADLHPERNHNMQKWVWVCCGQHREKYCKKKKQLLFSFTVCISIRNVAALKSACVLR